MMNRCQRISHSSTYTKSPAQSTVSRDRHYTWLALLVASCIFVAVPRQVHAREQRWVLIDTKTATIQVMRGDRIVIRYADIAVGRRGTSPLHMAGDDTTPLGTYHVNAIKHGGNYRIFISLDYPTIVHAAQALKQQKITRPQYLQIAEAFDQGRPPPADTPLGGAIGIHGIGGGNLQVHTEFNWTHGCVALDNRQIADLASRIRIGTRVVIR